MRLRPVIIVNSQLEFNIYCICVISDFQHFNKMLNLALAVVIIRTKPANLNTSEYCLHLRQMIIKKMLEGNREKSMLDDEVIRLKEQLISHRIMENTTKQQLEQLPSGKNQCSDFLFSTLLLLAISLHPLTMLLTLLLPVHSQWICSQS